MNLRRFHHVAVICSDYPRSKRFYAEILGLRILRETYREARRSYKLDLQIPGGGELELFSFPESPQRLTYPEARGLRHLAFAVESIDAAVDELRGREISVEAVRVDECTGKKYTFFLDPDGLPLELYESD